ncbi:MAG: 4Fe-4S binding protein [Clostridium sp.]
MTFYKKYGYLIFLTFLVASLFNMTLASIAVVCMVAPLVLALLGKGRFWCGNFCPRGNFYDNILKKFSLKKPVPKFFKSTFLRVFMIFFLIGMFTTGVIKNWGNPAGIGMVFYRIIVVTSLVGIVLGMFFSHRTWCNFCPMGTLASFIAKIRGKNINLKVDSSCVGCNLCAKKCPMGISAKEYKDSHILNTNCIHCNECVYACPKKSINLDTNFK